MPVNATSLYPNANITTFVKFFEYGNTVTGNSFTVGILGAFWIMMFIALKKFDTPSAFTTSSFITALVSILFKVAGLLSEQFALIPIVLVGFSVFLLFIKKD